jgi:hypothetical protein
MSPAQLAQHQQQQPPGGARTFSTLEGWGAPPKTNPGVATRAQAPEPVQTSSRLVMWIIVFAAALVVGVLLAVLA